MTKSEQVRQRLIELAEMQLLLEEKGGPSEDGHLFEEILSLQEDILNQFGLPATVENEKILWFNESLPTDLEVEERLKELHEKAREYLLSPAKSETQILKDAQENKASAFSTLPELGISTHTYTIFVYEKILLNKRDKIENVLNELKQANQPKLLQILGNLEQGNFDNPQEVINVLKENGLKYIDDFVGTFPNEEARNEGNQLLEFWNDIKGGYEFKSLDEKFGAHAHYLMNYLCLVVAGQPYRITEIEIYYHDKDLHPDPYVHCANEQLFAGNWYFNGAGLDITFGDYERKIYGGILIRGIMKFGENPRYISGPSNVLKEIFSSVGNILEGEGLVCLRELNQDVIQEIETEPIQTIRIGLTKKNDDKENFAEKNYRYLVELNLQHKFKDKEKVIRQLLATNQITKEQSKEIMGYNINL